MSAQPTARATAIPLAAFTAVYFTGFAAMTTYWPVWLADRGLGAVEIGALLTVSQWAKVPGTLLVGYASARLMAPHQLIILLSVLAALVMTLFGQASGFVPLLLLMACWGFIWPSMLPLSDSLMLAGAAHHGFDYGRVRLWGSVSYMVVAAGAGWLVAWGGSDAIYAFILAASGATVLSALAMPRETIAAKPAQNRPGMWALLRQRPFLLLMVVAGAAQMSHAVFYGFGTIAWRGMGISDGAIGLLWALGVVAEIILFAFAARISGRIGATGLLLLGALGGVVRWPLMALADNLAVIFALQLLHALTFGATHLGAMQFMVRAMAPADLPAAQSLYYALPMGIGMGLATLLAGYLYARFSVDAYLAMAVLSAIALICAWRLAGKKLQTA